LRCLIILLLVAWPAVEKLQAQSRARPDDTPSPNGQTVADATRLLDEARQLQGSPSAPALRRSIAIAERALTLSRSAGESTHQASALHTLARSRYLLADLEGAVQDYEAALSIRRELGDVHGEATTRAFLASAYFARGDHARALDEYAEAARLAEPLGQAGLMAYAVNGLGNVHGSRGDPIAAASAYERARALWQKADDPAGQAMALNNLGVLHERSGETQIALRMYRDALPRFRDANDLRRVAGTLHNMGTLNLRLGRTQQATVLFRQAMALERTTGDRRSEAQTRLSLAQAALRQNTPQSAARDMARALALARAVGDRDAEGDVLHGRGELLAARGRHREALASFAQARTLHETVGAIKGEADDVHATGRSLRALGELAQAMAAFDVALSLRIASRDRGGEAATRYEMARALADQNRLDDARSALEQTLALVESVRSGFTVQNISVAYFATVQSYYRSYIDLLMRSHRRDPTAGFDVQALDALARARARGLLDLLTEAGANVSADVPAALVDRQRELRRRISFTERQLAELTADAGAQRARLDRQVADLVNAAEVLEADIKESSRAYAALVRPAPLSAGRTQALLDDQTTLLVYGMGEVQAYAWIITRQSITAFDVAGIEEVRRGAFAAARSFEASRLGGPGAAAGRPSSGSPLLALSNVILAPVAAALRTPRVAIVPDGPLEYVPIGALPAPAAIPLLARSGVGAEPVEPVAWPRQIGAVSTYRPLAAEREVAYLPSASTLDLLRAQAAGRVPHDGTIKVFADPVFAGDDPRVARSARAAGPPRTDTLPPASDDGEMAALPRLPSTRREAAAIAATAGASAALALDFEATRTAALDAATSRARVVHFATHAVVDTARPELGGIHLSRVTSKGQPQEGLLHLQDVYTLRLSAELVVLSACRTAVGSEVRGEGLIGLVRGFMAAGAPRVVASLWSVDDAATAELMAAFYTALLRDRLPPAAALREAQRHLWQQPRWSSPFYWAAFVLQGDWQ
jgi:tetratricopeptide (TPR) repeat protein